MLHFFFDRQWSNFSFLAAYYLMGQSENLGLLWTMVLLVVIFIVDSIMRSFAEKNDESKS
jgi:hypothetical protein